MPDSSASRVIGSEMQARYELCYSNGELPIESGGMRTVSTIHYTNTEMCVCGVHLTSHYGNVNNDLFLKFNYVIVNIRAEISKGDIKYALISKTSKLN